jgi:2-polyprenyl-6-methoxyphenol hydroxylase-like FAD-dependent oxidoreductase
MTPSNLPTALVFGVGIGGIPLATRLVRREYKIVVVEKTVERSILFERLIEIGISNLDFWHVEGLRPKNRHQHYHNMYFVGASTHPGTDLPIVLLSAKLTSERIFNDVRSL